MNPTRSRCGQALRLQALRLGVTGNADRFLVAGRRIRKIMFVGRAAREQEDLDGKPFCWTGGGNFRLRAGRSRIDRSKTSVTNAVNSCNGEPGSAASSPRSLMRRKLMLAVPAGSEIFRASRK